MAILTRWSPMRDLMKLNWNLDHFFRDFMEPAEITEEGFCPSPRVESFRHDGSYILKVELPGVNPKDVRMTASEGFLTIEGERKRTEEVPEKSVICEEMCYGSFKRTLDLPEGAKTDQIKAKYHEGILEIMVPVEEKFIPKRIEIEVQKG